MRLFYALEIPEETRVELEKFGATLERPWRASNPKQMHITLAFMGEVPDNNLDKIIKAGEAAAAEISRFHVEISDTAVFPESGDPKVLYAQVAGGTTLAALAESLREKLGEFVDGKKFKAHLTLARSRNERARKVIRKFRGKWEVSSFALIKSTVNNNSATHEFIQRFNLK